MQAESQSSQSLRWVRLVAIALLVLGVFFRFSNLGAKVYWHDEVFTSLAITGQPEQYFTEDLFQDRLARPEDLLFYQRFESGVSLREMLIRKGTTDVQHPPLYYVLLRFWAQLVGTTPAIVRGFSALLSLLMFPAVYWLCLELFESQLSGWIALALFAVSPVHLVYAQEARQFGIWIALALFCSALLLRALRVPSRLNWVLYGLSMLVSFYTALFSACIALSHVAHTLLLDPDNRFDKIPPYLGKRTLYCCLALLAKAILFLPWTYFIITAREALDATLDWTSIALPFLLNVQISIFNFSSAFVDLHPDNTIAYVFVVPVLVLQGYALYSLLQNAPKRVWIFIFTFFGGTAAIFGLPDLFLGGQRFIVHRYLLPCIVSLQLAVVYLLTTCLSADRRSWKFNLGRSAFIFSIVLGIFSCGAYARADTWWNKTLNYNYPQLAERVDASDRPLIISDSRGYHPESLVSLCYLIRPQTQLLLLSPKTASLPVSAIPGTVKTIYLFNLPASFQQELESRTQETATPILQDPWNNILEIRWPADTTKDSGAAE